MEQKELTAQQRAKKKYYDKIKNNPEFNTFWKTKLPYHKANEAYLAYLTSTGLKAMGLDTDQYKNRLF
jgi:hypothetical protein